MQGMYHVTIRGNACEGRHATIFLVLRDELSSWTKMYSAQMFRHFAPDLWFCQNSIGAYLFIHIFQQFNLRFLNSQPSVYAYTK